MNSTATVTQISSSLNPSTYGSAVTFSTLVNSDGTNPTDTAATFFDSATNIGSAPVATTASTTNLLPYSQNTTQATWGPYCGSSANQSPATAPDGSLTATQIVLPSSFTCGSGNSWGTIDSIVGGSQAGPVYTVHAWLRGGAGRGRIVWS